MTKLNEKLVEKWMFEMKNSMKFEIVHIFVVRLTLLEIIFNALCQFIIHYYFLFNRDRPESRAQSVNLAQKGQLVSWGPADEKIKSSCVNNIEQIKTVVGSDTE